ncbi:ATP-binding protein [Synechococcus sp. CBW1006]|uniref:ATP-binding protein n=1 Tax=Synechococcus sp. CBW1006 TaxID=1353138 RepID=UPI0018CF3483|nr:MoxR family ATPase [Synechococcus sp. CBW1006]QPN66561.1 MoxR family ATPase [Synechococcus sp. CBW1006]
MTSLKPSQLISYLNQLVTSDLPISTMIWGPPGIGKSSIVAQVAQEAGMNFIDLRLSQLAPTDLRGLPVPVPPAKDDATGTSTWYPPEFLPRQGKGILFLDELNMAPPAMQGVAQQLILDRRVGSYVVPDGWFLWAAGNRKEDRASVFEMPAPLANRFLHLTVAADFDSFKSHALERGFSEQVIAFLGFRPTLLHKLDAKTPAWPSPRTWEMASRLHCANLPVDAAVGEGAASEFRAYLAVYDDLPDLDAIAAGKGDKIAFPNEASSRWATTTGLTVRSKKPAQVLAVFQWLIAKASEEWVQLYAADVVNQFQRRKQLANLAKVVMKDAAIQKYLEHYSQLIHQ